MPRWFFSPVVFMVLATSCGAVCGDGQTEASEECDDGNTEDADTCEGDCTLPKCGNGIVDPNEVCFLAPQAVSVGTQPDAIVAADFNQDASLDLAVANQGSNNVGILLSLNDGTFAPQTVFSVGTSPRSLAVEDLNLDGRQDLVTANNGDDTVSVLLGQDNTQFLPQAVLSTVASPVTVASFALANQSDKLNLIVGSASDTQIGLLAGAGDGTFVAQQTFFSSSGSSVLAVADFNNDLSQDIGATNVNGVGALLGDLNNTFSGFFFTPSQTTFFLKASDIDQDGLDDLVALDSAASDSVSFLRSRGDGLFDDPIQLFSGSAGKFFFADLDRDGVQDIAIASLSSGLVTVLLGNGNGTFGAPLTFPAGETPKDLTAADFNGDNRFDLAVTNQNRGEVSILLQQEP